MRVEITGRSNERPVILPAYDTYAVASALLIGHEVPIRVHTDEDVDSG